MFLESTALYGTSGEVPEEEYLIPLGRRRCQARGQGRHDRGARTAQCSRPSRPPNCSPPEHDVSAEVIDLRSIRPLDDANHHAERAQDASPRVLVEESKPLLWRRRADSPA